MNTCSVDRCELKAVARGWCQRHWQYHRRLGLLNTGQGPRSKEYLRKTCVVDGCDRSILARSWCDRHYKRWAHRGGDPAEYLTGLHGHHRQGHKHASWQGYDISYSAAHERVRSMFGPATQYDCIHCGKTAAHWSYDGTDPKQKFAPRRGSEGPCAFYSVWPEFYVPACVKCHLRIDKAKMAQERQLFQGMLHETGLSISDIKDALASFSGRGLND